ncbi:MAG: hypothetical protein HKN68_12670 [Saprospiraceae bacterium]|nr:hypothetical protein [Saprospiraceae bacterium]
MELSQADQYYLKALNEYPYNLGSMIENLQYAQSYDNEHAPSWCLLGQIHMYLLKDYRKAKHCYNQSIACDLNYRDAYKYLSLLYIWLGRYKQAKKVIQHGMKIPGMDQVIMSQHLAMVYEYRGNLSTSKMLLKQAKLITNDTQQINKIDAEINRVKKKQKQLKKLKSKYSNGSSIEAGMTEGKK